MSEHKNQNIWVWLVVVLIVAALLRFYGIDFGKPYFYHPDETKLISQAGRLLDTRFLDKEAYFGIRVYPPFYTYMLAAVMAVYIGLGLLSGHFSSLEAVKTAYQGDPFQFYLLSRSFVALFGVASVLLIYLIGKRLYSNKVGLSAAILLAVNFVHVRNSHFGTVDIPAAFFGLAVLWFCVLVMQEGRLRHYALAALFIALATATKFSMALFVLPLLYAHFGRFEAREWGRALLDKKIWIAAGVGVVSFLIACPLIWMDFRETWGGIVGAGRFEKVGKIGSGGGVLSYWTGDQSAGFGVFYPNSIPGVFGVVLTVLAALGILYLLFKHRRHDLLLLVCIVPVYLLFEKMSIKAMRHILPLIPLFVLAAVVLLNDIFARIKIRSLRLAGLLLVFGFLTASQAARALDYQKKLSHTDPRSLATEWILSHLPPGAAIAVESFPPILKVAGDSMSYTVYETDWTSRSKTRWQEFKTFVAQQDSIYYIADDFTRQIFTWKYTKTKYPEIAQERLSIFKWLDENAEKIRVFNSRAPHIQPKIVIYRLKGMQAH